MAAPHYKNSKWCFVPNCSNTSINSKKTFIYAPKDPKIRRKWFDMAHRDRRNMPTSPRLYCCEDHFNLQEDMANYTRWKLMGGKIFLKKGTLPSRFDCQQRSIATNATLVSPKRMAAKKRESYRRTEVVNQLLAESSSVPNHIPLDQNAHHNMEADMVDVSLENQPLQAGTIFCIKNVLDASIQVQSKYLTKGVCTTATSPIKLPEVPFVKLEETFEDLTCEEDMTGDPLYDPDYQPCREEYNSDCSFQCEMASTLASAHSYKISMIMYIETHSKLYLGVPDNCLFVTKLLANFIEYSGPKLTSLDIVYLVLKKIKLNEPFQILAHQFDIACTHHASNIFSKYAPVISHYLKDYIFWPESEKIKELLPLAFRTCFRKVESIIDCLEIEIEKPQDPVHQALTWSDYKKGNTVKYLISCTPDGHINFISEGFGGRITDVELVIQSEFLKVIRRGSSIIADKGFKNVETILNNHACKLIRLPSVLAKEKLSESLVRQGKTIASVRIHIERVIRRIREYHFLMFNASTDIHLVTTLDHAVVIACGLINLQAPYCTSS